MKLTLNLVPAYDKDYKSTKAVMDDWNANKDFKIYGTSTYVNKEQVPELLKDGYYTISFRYACMFKQHILTLTK